MTSYLATAGRAPRRAYALAASRLRERLGDGDARRVQAAAPPADIVIKVIVRAARSAVSILVCLILPLTTVVLVVVYGGRSRLAWDFHQAFLPAARAVLHGNDPYGGTTAATLHNGTAYVYPPLAAYLLAPVAALPTFPAEIIATLAAAAAALLTLLVLGVRDWRCYGVALLWAPVVFSIHLGALSTFLALTAAVAWRWRRSPWIGGIAVAIAVATKLFMWPLLVWLCLIRLWRTAAVATLGTFVLVFGPWAASGFASIGRYPQILHASEKIGGPEQLHAERSRGAIRGERHCRDSRHGYSRAALRRCGFRPGGLPAAGRYRILGDRRRPWTGA